MTAYNFYSKGSEWRKWDLHLHTPSSYDYDDNSVTNEEIIATLASNDISLAVVTDHHHIDVDRIKALQLEGLVHGVRILPGIEFRSELGGSESVHFIGIFPETSNLEELWIQIQAKCNLTPSEVATKGHENIVCSFVATANVVHELGGLISIHAGGKTNTIENITNALSDKQAVKRDFLNHIDIYEIGKIEDIQNYKEKVYPNISKRPPLVICSDNHNIKKYELRVGCWIKADCTFEGLKQIVFEPDERVCVQDMEPSLKHKYFVIDKVRFIDNTQSAFPSDYIDINEGLNVIIGGKSTGKSLLLYHVAKTVNTSEVNARFEGLPYSLEDAPDFNFEVVWADGESRTLNDCKDDRKVLYIPQSYLNSLAESDLKSKRILNDFVLRVILQDPTANEVYSSFTSEVEGTGKNIHTLINDLYIKRRDAESINEEMKKLGDEKSIIAGIKGLEESIEKMRKNTSLSEDETQKYQSLTKEKEALTNKMALLIQDAKQFGKHKDEVEYLFETLKKSHSDQKNMLSEFSNQDFDGSSILNDAHAKYIQLLNAQIGAVQKQREEVEQQIKKNDKELEPIVKKLSASKGLLEKTKSLEEEKRKLNEVKRLQKEREIKTESMKTTASSLKDLFVSLSTQHSAMQAELKKYEDRFREISLNISVKLNQPHFNEVVAELYKNSLSALEIAVDGDGDYVFDHQRYNDDIWKIFCGIWSGNVKQKSGASEQNIVHNLFTNRLFLDFDIQYKGDRLDKMSPGKKNFVLLCLLIDLSNEEWPILLDQPDDDLDNRSIYTELASFLKKKKNQRQMIIVTHNPNLVVGPDAEQVIVANQSGQEVGRENKKYRFEYVSGGLEYSFEKETETGILFQKGVREHVCEILEGGVEAFQKRENRYGANK